MALDHSRTYQSWRFRDVVHRLRLRDILRCLDGLGIAPGTTYADVGCSNGYLTALIAARYGLGRPNGFDHQPAHFDAGRAAGRDIRFVLVDLNARGAITETSQLVTCFETLEHTGELANAVDNVVGAIAPGGLAVITVPIEIGPKGLAKFLAKTLVYGDALDELPERAGGRRAYARALWRGERISRFRDARRAWGTHFGFDWRDVDDLLKTHPVSIDAFTRGTSRFFVVRR